MFIYIVLNYSIAIYQFNQSWEIFCF
jgi:hypothetical protein